DRANALSLKEIRGAVVGTVEEGSPAAKIGLKENDVILAFNTKLVYDRAHFHHLHMISRPGGKVSLGIRSGGVDKSLDVSLGQSGSPALDAGRKLFIEADSILKRAEDIHKEAEEALQNGEEKKGRELFEQEKIFRHESETRRVDIENQ